MTTRIRAAMGSDRSQVEQLLLSDIYNWTQWVWPMLAYRRRLRRWRICSQTGRDLPLPPRDHLPPQVVGEDRLLPFSPRIGLRQLGRVLLAKGIFCGGIGRGENRRLRRQRASAACVGSVDEDRRRRRRRRTRRTRAPGGGNLYRMAVSSRRRG